MESKQKTVMQLERKHKRMDKNILLEFTTRARDSVEANFHCFEDTRLMFMCHGQKVYHKHQKEIVNTFATLKTYWNRFTIMEKKKIEEDIMTEIMTGFHHDRERSNT